MRVGSQPAPARAMTLASSACSAAAVGGRVARGACAPIGAANSSVNRLGGHRIAYPRDHELDRYGGQKKSHETRKDANAGPAEPSHQTISKTE